MENNKVKEGKMLRSLLTQKTKKGNEHDEDQIC